jgi:hypothetical protein
MYNKNNKWTNLIENLSNGVPFFGYIIKVLVNEN